MYVPESKWGEVSCPARLALPPWLRTFSSDWELADFAPKYLSLGFTDACRTCIESKAKFKK